MFAEEELGITKDTSSSAVCLGVRAAIEQGNARDPSGPFMHFPNYLSRGHGGRVRQAIALTAEQINLLADFSY